MASANSKLMWHEARQQDKFMAKLLVDYTKRAERRKEYYEKIKLEPMQFLQVHGRVVRIHLDPAIYGAAEAPGTMLPWRGDTNCMIDRFDVRAHLDEIPTQPESSDDESGQSNHTLKANISPEDDWEERQANYERYRTLVQNEFLEISEEKFLQQIKTEELYGPAGNKSLEEEKKAAAAAPKKAAIGFVYNDDNQSAHTNTATAAAVGLPGSIPLPGGSKVAASTVAAAAAGGGADDESGDDNESDIDLDMTVDVMQLSNEQQQELNSAGKGYGLHTDDFMALISKDLQEAEELRQVKQHQDEKAMLSGRKSRKERRALKKKTVEKKPSPPSYAARSSPSYQAYKRHSSSRSPSASPPPPPATGKIKFITSFGGDSDPGGCSDKDESVTGVIILPKVATGTNGSKTRRDRDRRRKNRWDQTGPDKEREKIREKEREEEGGSREEKDFDRQRDRDRHRERERNRDRTGGRGELRDQRDRDGRVRGGSSGRDRDHRDRYRGRDGGGGANDNRLLPKSRSVLLLVFLIPGCANTRS